MDIFGSQLEEALPVLQEQIQGCDFIAIDMEFTGLHSVLPHNLKPSLFDSADDWYRKVKSSIQKFTVCQIGLSIFFKQKSNRFLSYSYNFYLFPLTFGSVDSEFSIQATSIQFLNEFGFDFNKLLVRKVNRQRRQQLENSSLDPCNRNRVLLLARGFTNIFQSIVGAKKPLVGHNMLMDLLHLHHKFYRPLPDSYSEFKKNIHTLFPVLIDTKMLMRSVWKEFQFPHAATLLEIFDVLSSDMNPASPSCPLIEHATDCRKYVKNRCPHEAAYDAFLCGSVLIHMTHLLLVTGQGETEELERSYSQYVKIASKYINQVNVIHAGFSCVNFSGPDPCSHRPPTLLLTVRGWPDVDEEQIYRAFLSICRVDVKRLRGTQFLLLTTKFKGARAMQKEYKGHPNFQLCAYRYWRHSPLVCCVFSVCSVILAWSAVAFILGKSVPHHL
uniref:Poly(A)-specific ribonuclease PNLDC1 isoform X5 n=1 Tax=Geotrypetes seraphini TaxID=260995 RepID=A0A6P8NKX5_GEOSA|nr:poly(A)-specific ribonuclease PNLDC1 isoform X5 [Geotrypetes seraphini]